MPIRSLMSLVASTLPLAACIGIDPSSFERLSYGMEQRHIAASLDATPIPVMRFFAVDEAGREQDVLIEVCEGREPHPYYALVSIDGRFASLSIASRPRFFFAGEWWRDPMHWDRRELVCPWWPEDLRGLVGIADQRRLPLAWEQLEPFDSAQVTRGRYTGIGMATVLVVPLVLYVPYYAWNELFVDDGFERADAARTYLLTTPAGTTAEQVVAALGPPTSEQETDDAGRVLRVLTYELGEFTITVGFLDAGLLWADFGSWYDWAQSFVDM